MNRRESIKAIGLTTVGTGILLESCTQEDSNKAGKATEPTSKKLPGVQDFEHVRNTRLSSEQFFTDHEMATITVLSDIIIPKDDFSESASAAGVPAFIEFMVKDIPDYKLPMRGGLKWLDVQCLKRYNKVFVDCDEKEQLNMVDEIAYPLKARPEMQQGVAFFNLMRSLTASGFFTSEIGVKDIGYVGNRPGPWDGVPEDVLSQYGFTGNE
ncbi:gluconate 2-dehydrogenase subunit 3 family protein [Olivibacter sp. XZL3]|uniref:gluconate 2-dehydrogenase subunit 3 family protein n=1 Tax=Olivibacter sp. XZL3 TaxID=1735116 RepID=UPI00106711BF|nr:gluconate 2-dehydrogenase subunit 3 family protein [Olivibacter sp. XZL3]